MSTRMSRQEFERIKVQDFDRLEAEVARLTQERDALAVALASTREALDVLAHPRVLSVNGEILLVENRAAWLDAARAILAADQPAAVGAELLAAIDGLQRRWDAVCRCVDEFEPDDMRACDEAKILLDDAILNVLRARAGQRAAGPGREGA